MVIFSSAHAFNLDKSKILKMLLSGKELKSTSGLTLSQTTIFRLFQTERDLQTSILNLMKMVESSPNG